MSSGDINDNSGRTMRTEELAQNTGAPEELDPKKWAPRVIDPYEPFVLAAARIADLQASLDMAVKALRGLVDANMNCYQSEAMRTAVEVLAKLEKGEIPDAKVVTGNRSPLVDFYQTAEFKEARRQRETEEEK